MEKIKIIVVDNDEDEQYFIKEGLDSLEEFELLAQVENGDSLMNWLENHPTELPDLILSDLNMPGRNGFDILSDIRAESSYRAIAVVITSNSSTEPIVARCKELGAIAYMVKPDSFIDYGPFLKNLYQVVRNQKQ